MNRLSGEASPYLRQHETNPVDWYPWGDEAFARARERDRPILLSVGYSACHWCHVMAHESFENEVTAARMNELFVNVKVDREERPDVDAVYMEAVQAMTGRGGWPMTAFLLPDGRPFYAGTYFPAEPRQGMTSFRQLLDAIEQAWREQRDDLVEQAEQLTAAVRDGATFSVGSTAIATTRNPLDAEEALRASAADLLIEAVRALMNAHDDEWGGFGRAPKFPNTMALELLIRALHHGADDQVLRALTTSLDCMVSGGMYDHLGGGFARYSVDDRWTIPHFEKMLYDQAAMVRVYAHAYRLTGELRWRQIVDETVTYLARDVRLPGGAFASAEDADSEGVEGTFYVWTPQEVDEVLGPGVGPTARAHWAITEAPNFEERTIPTLAARGALSRTAALDDARERLLAHRSSRVRPGLDDKVLTEWNAMIISALSEAGRALDEPTYVALALDVAQFLVGHLRRSDGRWLRSWHASSGPKHLAGAADLAALIDAFVRLSEATGEARWLSRASDAADALLDHHEDRDQGGFFTVADDGEQLLVRQKDLIDNATPSATSTAALALQRLAALTGDDRYRAAAVRALGLVSATAAATPLAFAHALCALDLFVDGPTEVVIAGPPSPEREALLDRYWSRHRPNAVLAYGEPTGSELWAGRHHLDYLRAYVCRNFVCERPTDDPDELATLLGDG